MKKIGFFDSGLGGLSVLQEAIKFLPREKYIYFGDSKNNPYGILEREQILIFTENAVKFFLKKNVDAIVIACNTATSAAVNLLREKYQIPIIGMEPALKPAAESNSENGEIIVMATPFTLSEEKFENLFSRFKDYAKIHRIAAPKLVSMVENIEIDVKELDEYLDLIFSKINLLKVTACVLGCTHFIFLKSFLEKKYPHIEFFDGNEGTIKHLAKTLKIEISTKRENLYSDIEKNIQIFNSYPELVEKSFNLIVKGVTFKTFEEEV